MAENVVLQNVATLQNSSIVAAINANNIIITNAFADCLSLAGNQPNQMLSNLDMNSQQIINLPPPGTLNSPVRVADLTASTSSLSPALFALLAANNVFTGIQTFSNTTQSTTPTTGALVVSGGLGVAKNLVVGGSLVVGSFSSAVIAGGINANSTLTLESTSNVAPSGDSISVQGSKIFFKSTTGGSTFGDYNNTTSSTWTFTGNVTVAGNLSVTGSSSTFSFSGSNLGLGTATPATHAGFATLTTNGTTGGSGDFQTAGVTAVRIFNNGAANLTHSLTSAAGTYLFYVNTLTTLVLDYNTTNVNAWTFSQPVFVTGGITTTSIGQFATLGVTGAASNIVVSGAAIFGGTGAASNFTLASTSSGAPSGDLIIIRGSKIFFQNPTGSPTFADYNNTTASAWTFNAKVTGTGLFGTSSAGSVTAPSLYAGNVTTGFYSISTTGLGIAVNGIGIADFGITNVNAWTFRGSSGLIVDTSTGQMIVATSSATDGENSIRVINTGTATGVHTTSASLYAVISGIANGIASLAVGFNGGNPVSLFNSGLGLTGGFFITSLAGPIAFNAKTSILLLSNSAGVGDYGSTVAGTWTFNNSVVLGSSTGTLKVGGSGMTIANGAVATTMTSLGPAGSHTTIQEWMVVSNPSGTVRYIPLY